jgi:transposase-like protein/ribosomal protein L37AE/L43A
MVQYRSNQTQFEAEYASEWTCKEHLFHLRWPKGFRCPHCGNDGYRELRSDWMQCRKCGHQTSLTAGTIFQGTHKPLVEWFRAMYWLVSQKNGASALELQKALGLGSYKTAWTWLHKLRRAMVRPGRDRLSGRVEVGITDWGGLERGSQERQRQDRALIVIAAQEGGPDIGRISVKRIPDASADSLTAFIQEAIEPGSTVHTDGRQGFSEVEEKGYIHQVAGVNGKNEPATELLPQVRLIASLLKRRMLAAHQGAVSCEHLEFYLDEFTFRFNWRRTKKRGVLVDRLLQQAVAVAPVPYKAMIRRTANRNPAL